MPTALLIIDVQQGLREGGGQAADTAEVIARINLVSAKARVAQAPVIFVQHESTTGYLEQGSRAWQLANGLHIDAGDICIRKTTPDAFHMTDLHLLLQGRGITRLIVCGMHSEFCVDTTVRRALALGYPMDLVADAHTSAGNAVLTARQVIAHHNLTLGNIASFGPRAHAITSDALQIGA